MKNRSNTPSRAETTFIHGGSAGIDKSVNATDKIRSINKAKPVSISFFEDNLNDIDSIIRNEMISGSARVNRSDVVRAAVSALKNQSKSEISRLISEAKQK